MNKARFGFAGLLEVGTLLCILTLQSSPSSLHRAINGIHPVQPILPKSAPSSRPLEAALPIGETRQNHVLFQPRAQDRSEAGDRSAFSSHSLSLSLSHSSTPNRSRAQNLLANLPLQFEENKGQTASQVKYLSRGPGHTLYLTPTEAVMSSRTHPSTHAPICKPPGRAAPSTTLLRDTVAPPWFCICAPGR